MVKIKTLLLFVFTLFAINIYGQSKVKIENGYSVIYSNMYYRSIERVDIPKFELRYQLSVNWKRFDVTADNFLYMEKDKSFKFAPKLFIFDINATYSISNKIKVFVKHRCVHPVISGDYTRLTGGGDLIGISYNLKNN